MTALLDRKRPSRSPGRRLLTVIGVTLILAGLGLVLYFVWQYFGTNIVSKQRQAEVKQTLAQDWDRGVESRDIGGIGLLRVERWGDDYEAPIVEGFDDDALARGVGTYEKAAKPGQIGNFAIAGHRVTHGELFKDFPKLRKGDLVVVETRTNVFTYKLRNGGKDITVDFTVGWPLQRVPDPQRSGRSPTKAIITLLTCSELFHTRNRDVVIGDLVSSVNKATETKATSG